MSTIVSPRVSSSVRSPSSSRTSLDLPATPRPQQQSQRRNRTALRDYYGLKAGTEISNEPPAPLSKDATPVSELDRGGFDAGTYVKSVLATQNLETVLKTERDLISEIKNLDGERKALVYDNYSKLIAATETIKRMRTNLDPLTPATSTLSPAIAHIADTSAALSSSLSERTSGARDSVAESDNSGHMRSQRQTVQWALDTPRRMQSHIDQEDMAAAMAEYQEISPLLDNWKAVGGVEELREKCKAMLLED